ncbi:hypothetical protein H257_09058 [Aphanomyces astaci]|uniref:Uncharacterized protein n=1 Tax=Aphanomyces astaci TaxID=112090 RepID=W4GBW6_APHAT|nr:hypothetical protein H257_09058 [Aphanomyces astaci]ETV77172.1 hypothetical protein H257_09058 [Aphanomyces astaci]|eukprot:XP_009833478.1 hypothetical protein H257_09058 [Aphanomyces astaci]
MSFATWCIKNGEGAMSTTGALQWSDFDGVHRAVKMYTCSLGARLNWNSKGNSEVRLASGDVHEAPTKHINIDDGLLQEVVDLRCDMRRLQESMTRVQDILLNMQASRCSCSSGHALMHAHVQVAAVHKQCRPFAQVRQNKSLSAGSDESSDDCFDVDFDRPNGPAGTATSYAKFVKSIPPPLGFDFVGNIRAELRRIGLVD